MKLTQFAGELSGAGGAVPSVVPVVLNGPGRVGREFVRLLLEKASWIKGCSGVQPVLSAVVGRRGILVCRQGLSYADVARWADSGGLSPIDNEEGANGVRRLSFLPSSDYSIALDLVRRQAAGVVVEATPTDLTTGEPGLSHITIAMQKGFSAVSLSKGPLAVAFNDLMALAREKGVSLKYSGAVAAALPTIDTAMYSMAGAGIFEVEGVLNGTTNFILNSMAMGKSYQEALTKAQSMGVAEANPTLDVEGFDSAAKLLILANTIWGCGLKLPSVERQGITQLDAGSVRASAEAGTPVKLIARATLADPETGTPKLSVKPEPVPVGHPFAYLPGTAKAVRFRSRDMGEIVVLGGASDVTGAAASALKDLVHVLQERAARREGVPSR